MSGVTANWKEHEDFARDFLAQFERGTPGTFTANDGAVAQQFRQPWEPFRATPPARCVPRPVTSSHANTPELTETPRPTRPLPTHTGGSRGLQSFVIASRL